MYARFLHAFRVPDVPPGEAPLFVCCRPIISGTIPWHTGCTLKVPYGAVSGIPNLIFGGVIGDTEDFEVLFGLDDLVVRVGRIGVYHWIEPVTLCPFGGNLHGQFKGIGCTLFGIVQGCGADPEFRCWG